MRTAIPLAIALLATSACIPQGVQPEQTGQAAAEQTMTVSGTATYRQRIALPPGAVMTVQVLDISLADAPAVVLAEQKIATQGRQVPIPFSLTLPRAKLPPVPRSTVSIRITDADGRLLWITDTIRPVEPGAKVDMGEIVLISTQ